MESKNGGNEGMEIGTGETGRWEGRSRLHRSPFQTSDRPIPSWFPCFFIVPAQSPFIQIVYTVTCSFSWQLWKSTTTLELTIQERTAIKTEGAE